MCKFGKGAWRWEKGHGAGEKGHGGAIVKVARGNTSPS